MRILVTGGSGRLGGYILRELTGAGYDCASLGHNPPMIDRVEFVPGDIMDPQSLKRAFEGYDAVIHLSAVSHPKRATPEVLRQINIIGTYNVLDSAVVAGVDRVVFASSGAAMGFSFQVRDMSPLYFPVDEEHPCAPQDEYGLSKIIGETMCKSFSDTHGISTLCLRINANWPLDRPGAEIAAKSGAYRTNPMSVESMWEMYRSQIVSPDSPSPYPGPPPPHKNLWMYTDARDCAQIFRLAVEDKTVMHEVFQTCAADTWSMLPTAELLKKHYPDVPLKRPLGEYDAVVSHAKAEQSLGFRPRHRWRETDFGEWVRKRE